MFVLPNSCIFFSKSSFRCKIYGLYSIMAFFFTAAIVSMIITLTSFSNLHPFKNLGSDKKVLPSQTNKFRMYIDIGLTFPLILTIFYFYLCMRNTLSKCTTSNFSSEQLQIKKFFRIITVAYIFRFVYSCGMPFYKELICQFFMR